VVNGLGIVKNLASQYFVLAKNASGTKASNDKSWDPQDLTALIEHVKSPNTDEDLFGQKIALSSDGKTLVVGAAYESSNAKGVNAGKEDNNDAIEAGAVYVFRYSDSTSKWTEQAYIKASNTEAGDGFGATIALSSDGNTLAVGAFKEDSNAKGVNTGEQGNNDSTDSGAVYVFRDSGTGWTQQAYIKASNSEPDDLFGKSVALSPDGKTLAVGATGESSSDKGINGNQDDNSSIGSGAVYIFRDSGIGWDQQAYIKASDINSLDFFGASVALSLDGNTLAVSATNKELSYTGVNPNESIDNLLGAGSVYLFRYSDSESKWTEQARLKSSNLDSGDHFGDSVALSSDGNTLAVTAPEEGSNAIGVNGNQDDNSNEFAGAVYLFRYSDSVLEWTQQAYIKASNTGVEDNFGASIALSPDGNTLAVGASGESSNATGINGNQDDNSDQYAGAAYLFRYSEAGWTQQAYIKPSNTSEGNGFGDSIALSLNGNKMAVGAPYGYINPDDKNNSTFDTASVIYFY